MYNDLKNIYNKYNKAVFAAGIAHLLDIGFKAAKTITDEQITKIPKTSWATAEFLRDVVTVARDIAITINSPSELIMFCEVESIFDTRYYAPNKRPISWERLSEIADKAISCILYDTDEDDFDGIDYALQDADLDLDDEEREFFGVPVNEDEDW